MSKKTKIIILAISVGISLVSFFTFSHFKQQVAQGELDKLQPVVIETAANSGSPKDTSGLYTTHCYGTGNTGTCMTTSIKTGHVVMVAQEDYQFDTGFTGDKHAESRNRVMQKYLKDMNWVAAHMDCSYYAKYGAGKEAMTTEYALDKQKKLLCSDEYADQK
ncbi:hypothetical protein [Pedobacter sp.]|uniref:hypothetical protein n=1 Tax=Pedobacter sp. TaxID=1411316 RepID=UPI003D7F7253